MNECSSAIGITAIACQLMKCMEPDELSVLSADLVQLADTLTAMLTRSEVCQNKNSETKNVEAENNSYTSA